MSARTRLAVWGDPIEHSRSPLLHAAAYRELGLQWTYDRRQVDAAGFDGALGGLDGTWRGLSLTMPLKGVAFRAAIEADRRAYLTGAVNTLLLTDEGARGFNTDVGGIVRALNDEGLTAVESARIVGAGATATSAMVALSELGARTVTVVARRRDSVAPLAELGALLGIEVRAAVFDEPSGGDVTIATIPGDATLADGAADRLAAAGGILLDVVYGTWPTPLAGAWQRAGAPALNGLGMLLHQALLQVRVFVNGDPDAELDHEASVLAVMRSSVVGD